MSVSWVLNHLCLVEMMLYCRAGREGRCLKTNPKQSSKCYWWLSGSLFSLLRPKLCFCKSQRTAEYVVTMSLTEHQELAPKLTYCILNSPLYFSQQERKSCLFLFISSFPFYKVNCPFLPACLDLLAYPHGIPLPGCSYLCLTAYVSSEPWMLGSSVLCRPHSHDRAIGWHMTSHRIKGLMIL